MAKKDHYRWVIGLVLFLFVFSLMFSDPAPVQAGAIIEVTTWEDEVVKGIPSNSLCSLREAVISANEGRAFGGCRSGTIGHDEIVLPANLISGGLPRNFEVLGTPNNDDARTGDLDILEAVTIRGAGPDKTTIYGNLQDRVFHIIRLGSNLVTLEGMKITRGSSVEEGGGVLNFASTLILSNVNLTGNHANGWGGGVRNTIQLSPYIKGTLTIKNSNISVNTTTEEGGGIDNVGDLKIYNSIISNNTAGRTGGGIYNNAYVGINPPITHSAYI